MDKLIDSGAQTSTYTGAGVAVYYGWFNIHEWAAIAGALVAVLGFAVHVWYTVQRNRRAEEAHRAEMEGLRGAKAFERQRASQDRDTTS